MLFSADFYPTQEEAIAQLGQYFQSPERINQDALSANLMRLKRLW